MFAKVVIFCAALAAAHASLAGPLGYGAPVLTAGHLGLGLGKGLIAAPAVATVSSQKTAINHVAPAAPVVAAAPLAYGYNGILANGLYAGHGLAGPLAYGHGLAGPLAYGHGLAGPLGYGHGLVGAPYGLGVGKLGLGKVIL
ncbi:uncharacterized protein TNCT_116261 [Trichonephila clavata]|uniref:Uncharacterized protein n=1 Tax=Trichonephila clavata TaxID=2740835 RepID=A0A8X6LPE5_TRICU|nr:uncharacterized protein TNCT_116261 [Trichonephila clavata]